MLRFGPDSGPVVVVALPLFEEANRVRAFAVSVLRALAEQGLASALPDLPGTGDSLVPLRDVALEQLRQAFGDAADRIHAEGRHTYSLTIRSGTLLDTDAALYGRWRLAPQTGHELLRELGRVWQTGGPGRLLGEAWHMEPNDPDAPIEVAGNMIGAGLLAELMTGEGWWPKNGHGRTVRLLTDARRADLKLAGTPLWRRAEPSNDIAFAQVLADDIAQWVRACEGC